MDEKKSYDINYINNRFLLLEGEIEELKKELHKCVGMRHFEDSLCKDRARIYALEAMHKIGDQHVNPFTRLWFKFAFWPKGQWVIISIKDIFELKRRALLRLFGVKVDVKRPHSHWEGDKILLKYINAEMHRRENLLHGGIGVTDEWKDPEMIRRKVKRNLNKDLLMQFDRYFLGVCLPKDVNELQNKLNKKES